MMRTQAGVTGRESGTILVSAVFTAFFLAGMVVAFFSVSLEQTESTRSRFDKARAFQTAESGVEETVERMSLGAPLRTGAAGDVTWFEGELPLGDGGVYGRYETAATYRGNGRFSISARSVSGAGGRGAVEAIVEERVHEMSVNTGAAVTAHGNVATLGNITIDGNDHDYDGRLTGHPGTFGVASGGLVAAGGSSKIGGSGRPPTKVPTDGAEFKQSLKFGDGVDADGDGRIDEERFDGRDDDGDGRIDEDLAAYPPSPDSYLELPEGTLKRVAQLRGTYFPDAASFESFLSRHGGMPGGAVVYLDFDLWQPADFGPDANDPPSIVVLHNAGGTALAKNLHGSFRGLLMADRIEHINGDYRILGAIVSFAPQGFSHVFGNGNARLYYSSAVLARLPSVAVERDFAIKAWRQTAISEIGAEMP